MEAGRVVIRCHVWGGRFGSVAVAVERPTGLAGRLVGQPVATAISTIGLLFPLCGAAHRAALAAALGAPAMPAPVLAAERLVARAWRLALDLPPLMGLPDNPQALLAVRKPAAAGDLAAAETALDRLAEGFAVPDAGFAWLEAQARAGAGPVARLLADALAHGPGFGVAGAPLRQPDAATFDQSLALPGFGANPTLDGQPAEIGPLAEACAARLPVVEAVIDRFGPGHFARLVAALTAPAVRQPPARHGATGLAPTARGPLAYRATQAGGIVTAIAAAAPTEWHFHPQGPFAQALAGARAGDDPDRTVRLLAFGFDPCVPLAVTLAATPHREPAHA